MVCDYKVQRTEHNKKSLLICFTGIDGSGKTTLAKILVSTMHEQGIKSKYVWCGWRQFESPLLAPFAIVVRRLLFQGRDNSAKQDVSIKRVQNPIYRYLILLDYLLSALLRVKVPLMLGQNIVCDRYVYDVMADLVANHKKFEKALLNLLPKADLIFFIDLPEEIAYRRKEDVLSVDHLREQRDIYLSLEEEYEMTVLDGSRDLEELRNTVRNQTMRLIKGS